MSDVEQMSDAPTPHARIWLTPPCCGNYEHGEVTWCQDAVNECCNCGAQPTEYVPAARLSTLTAALAAVTAERDALREALNEAAQFIEVVASADFDEIAADGGVDVGMVIQKQAATVNAPRARAALTANHSAPVVEE